MFKTATLNDRTQKNADAFDRKDHMASRTHTHTRTHARTHARMYARTHARTHAHTHEKRKKERKKERQKEKKEAWSQCHKRPKLKRALGSMSQRNTVVLVRKEPWGQCHEGILWSWSEKSPGVNDTKEYCGLGQKGAPGSMSQRNIGL